MCKTKVMESGDCFVVWNKSIKQENLFPLGMIKSIRTALQLLRRNSTVAYAVDFVLLNFSRDFQQNLKDHGHTYVGLLLESTLAAEPHPSFDKFNDKNCRKCPDQLCHCLTGSPDLSEETWEICIAFHSSRNTGTDYFSFEWQCENRIPVFIKIKKWHCSPVTVSYCCGIPEIKDMFRILHCDMAHSCVQCFKKK